MSAATMLIDPLAHSSSRRANNPNCAGSRAGSARPRCRKACAGEQPAARRALQEALLDQERLDDVLDRVARLRQRRRERLDADRAAAVILARWS